MMMLFEGGILGSFKIEELSDDLLTALEMLEDDAFLDFFIPIIVAIFAAAALFMKRRRASQLL